MKDFITAYERVSEINKKGMTKKHMALLTIFLLTIFL